MMMKSGRMRILGVVLCLALALGSFPASAYADTGLTLNDGTGGSGSGSLVVDNETGGAGTPVVPPPPANDGSEGAGAPSGPVAAPTSAEELASAKANTQEFKTTVAPDEILSGADTTKPTLIMYLGYNDYGGPAVDATKIKAVITVPKGVEAQIQGSDMFEGEQATDTSTGITTITMSMQTLPDAGSGMGSEYITFQTQKDGLVPDGTIYQIDVKWMYGDDVLIDTVTHPITVETSRFRWSNFRHSSRMGTVTSVEDQTTEDFFATTTTNFYIANDFAAAQAGKALTKSISVTEEFLVSDDVILTQEMLDENQTTAYGTWTFTPLEYYNEGQPNASIKKFRASITYENPSLSGSAPTDLGTMSGVIPLTVKVKVNREKLDPTLKKGDKITLSNVVKTSEYSATVKPAANVKVGSPYNAVTEENGEQKQDLSGHTSYFNYMNVEYTRPGVEDVIPDPLASAKGVKNAAHRLNIDGVEQPDKSIAYPGDRVIFTLDQFGNFSNIDLENFKITDKINLKEMTLLRYIPGGSFKNYGNNVYYTVRIYVQPEGESEREALRHNYNFASAYSNFPESTSYVSLMRVKGNITGSTDFNKDINVSEISKIEFDYGTYETPNGTVNKKNILPPGFTSSYESNTAYRPALDVLIKNNGQASPPVGSGGDPPIISNTAYLSYSYTGKDEHGQEVTKTYPEDAEDQVDKDKFVWERGLSYYSDPQSVTGSTKKGRKIRGSNPAGPVENGDLVEYTVEFSHKHYAYLDKTLSNPFIDDVYEGMEPYVADTDDVLSHYANAPFIAVLKVTDISGYDVTTARNLKYKSYHIGENEPGAGAYDPVISKPNTLRMRFTGEIYYGDTISITYVMKITDVNKIKNSFTAWAYPPGTGGSPIQIGGGESTGGAGGIAPQYKPTLEFTQTVLNPNGSVNSNSVTGMAKKDDVLTVKLVISNTAGVKYAGAATFYGVMSRFDTYNNNYQDYAEHMSENATYRYYKYGSTTPHTTGEMVRHTTTSSFSTGRYVDGCGYQLKNGLFTTHLVLNRGDRVEVEYTIKATDWLDVNKTYAYEYIQSYGVFGELTTDIYYPNVSASDDRGTNYDQNNKTQSFAGLSKAVYVAKEDLLYAGIYRYIGTDPLPFNNDDNMPSRTFGPSILLYNYSATKTMTVDKVFVRLPKHEEFESMYSTQHKGVVLDGLYGPEGDKRQVVMVTNSNGAPFSIAPNGTSGYIRLNTTLTEESRAELMKAKRPSAGANYYDFYNSDFEVLIHTGESTLTTRSDPIVQVKGDDLANWGGSNMGLSDEFCYKADANPVNVRYRRYYPAPRVALTTQKYLNNGGVWEWTDAVNGESFATEAKISWKLYVAPYSSSAYRPMLKETVLVLKVPMGVKYQRVREGDVTVQELTIDGVDYLVIPLDAMTATTGKTFILEGNTGAVYGAKEMEAYLFTNEEFYVASPTLNNIPLLSCVISKAASNLPVDQISAVDGTYESVVKVSSSVTVSGMFAFVMNKTVNGETETTLTKRGDSTLNYELQLKNNSAVTAYTNVTIIDRLPAEKDNYITYNTLRGSNTAVKLKNAHPVVKLGTTTLTEGSQYKLYYANANANQQFVDQDFRLTEDGLTSGITWTPKSSWSDITTADIFRIDLNSSLAKGATLTVSFTGTAPTDKMPNRSPQALNTFAAGFSAVLGSATFGVKPESNIARVKFPDSMPMMVEGTLFLDENHDGAYTPSSDPPDKLYQEKETDESKKLRVELYNITDETTPVQKVYPVNGKYTFEAVNDPGKYYVKLVNVPADLFIFDEIVTNNENTGNRFYDTTLKTDVIELPEGNPTTITHVRNGALLTDDFGTLEIYKKVTTLGNWFGGTGDKNQKFLFKIEGTPVDSKRGKIAFYEVVQDQATRTITGLPRGTYTVTEIDWATGYEQTGTIDYGSAGQTITYRNGNLRAECKNKKIGENFVHGIDSVNNTFKG